MNQHSLECSIDFELSSEDSKKFLDRLFDVEQQLGTGKWKCFKGNLTSFLDGIAYAIRNALVLEYNHTFISETDSERDYLRRVFLDVLDKYFGVPFDAVNLEKNVFVLSGGVRITFSSMQSEVKKIYGAEVVFPGPIYEGSLNLHSSFFGMQCSVYLGVFSTSAIFRHAYEIAKVITTINHFKYSIMVHPENDTYLTNTEKGIDIELKILPQYFSDVYAGRKRFEIRRNDRDFRVGDKVTLKEWDNGYTGSYVEVVITYITDYEQTDNYVVFGFDVLSQHKPAPERIAPREAV